MDFLKIDGSFGEGGGQIIRTAVTLSCITKIPVHIENIRKNRKDPGLKAQHFMGIKLLSKICDAKVEGLEIGSTEIKFTPGEVQSLKLEEDVGTAGSISLILQILIVAVAFSKRNLKLIIRGGTDVSWSPTIDFTKNVPAAAYSRMGINFCLDVQKRGYYPKGGGKVSIEIFPTRQTSVINLTSRQTRLANLHCVFSRFPRESITKQIDQIKNELEKNDFQVNVYVKEEDALNGGGSLLIHSQDPDSVIGVDGLLDMKNGKFPHDIAKRFVSSNLGVDVNLADMLVVPASLINGTTIFRVNEISKHLETNLHIASEITGCKYGVGKVTGGYEIRIVGNSDTCIQ